MDWAIMDISLDAPDEETLVSGLRIVVDQANYGETIANVLRRGTYEGRERDVLQKFVWRGDRVLEVGSALGCVSMVAARIVGEANVLTFEANPKMIEDAKKNFKLNGMNIEVRNAVLKNRVCWTGTGISVPFHIQKEFWASSLLPLPGSTETILVPTACFEEVANAFVANVLVCDIEGGEVELLELADLTGFNKILIELHYWAAGRESTNRLIRKLIIDGFSIDFDLSFGSVVCLHRGLLPPSRA